MGRKLSLQPIWWQMAAMGGKRTFSPITDRARHQHFMRTLASLSIVLVCVASPSAGYAGAAPAPRGWSSPVTGKPAYWTKNTITVRGKQLRWNGVSVDAVTLLRYVRESATYSPLPLLVFDGSPAGSVYASHIRDLIERNYPCRTGACFQGSDLELNRTRYRRRDGPPS